MLSLATVAGPSGRPALTEQLEPSIRNAKLKPKRAELPETKKRNCTFTDEMAAFAKEALTATILTLRRGNRAN